MKKYLIILIISFTFTNASSFLVGLDDIPMRERRNKLIAGETYTDKVMYQAMYNVNKDKQR